MEVILPFAVMVIAISASGVMSPGPLFTANIVYGLKEGKIAGLKIAMGHTTCLFWYSVSFTNLTLDSHYINLNR